MIVLYFLELALACSNPLILSLRIKFKDEGLPTLAVTFRENFWFFTFDIESGYHHLGINSY